MIKKKKLEPFTVHKFRYLRGWSDVDFKILHACFNFLEDFVEKEKGLENLKSQYDLYRDMSTQDRKDWNIQTKQEHKNLLIKTKQEHDEVETLYNWWKKEYVPLWKKGGWNGLYNKENEMKEQEMLVRLVVIRRVLWT